MMLQELWNRPCADSHIDLKDFIAYDTFYRSRSDNNELAFAWVSSILSQESES
jgi:hypothetical protein